MNSADKLREFHKKHNFPVDLPLAVCFDEESPDQIHATEVLRRTSEILLSCSKYIELCLANNKDVRLVRAQLGVEEMGEAVQALAECDELLLIDALADVKYINEGTAVTFGLPLQEAFDIVHDSNMSKAARDPNDPRLRDKGDSYVPAEEGLKKLLEDSR